MLRPQAGCGARTCLEFFAFSGTSPAKRKGMIAFMNASYPLRREKIADGVWFGSIADSRFKTNLLTLNLVLPLRRETVTGNALLPQVLEKGYRLFPTYREFSMRLNRLYGASVNTGCTKIGDNEVLTISISAIDDAYALAGEPLLRECAEILCGLLLDPVLKDGVLEPENLALQKQYLIDSIQAEINEKRSYALGRTLALMFENDPYGLRKLGYVEDAEKITPESATADYRRILDTARIEIFHVGRGDPAPAREVFAAAFSALRRRPEELAETAIAVAHGESKDVVEEKKVSQSKLCLGFKTGVGADHPQLSALRLMNGVLGGSPTSKLFLNVREKRSLCYYCASRTDRTKGILLIDCGVEREKVEEAKEAIFAELEAVRRGEITDEELNFARLSLQNSFRSIGETAYSMESFYLAQTLLGLEETPQDQCDKLDRVGREEAAEAAQLVKLDTVYLLAGERREEESDA